jgi:hypothetical protein
MQSAAPLVANLGLASAMVALTVLVHFWGLLALTRIVSGGSRRFRAHEGAGRAAVVILVGVFGVFALHTIEIWLYAALYRLLGEMGTLEQSLYFSTVTFASLGYGDIVLSPRWRLLSAIEASNGVILFAWSTAFLLTVTRRLNVLEHDWLERHERSGA